MGAFLPSAPSAAAIGAGCHVSGGSSGPHQGMNIFFALLDYVLGHAGPRTGQARQKPRAPPGELGGVGSCSEPQAPHAWSGS